MTAMFSALKRLTGRTDGVGGGGLPRPSHQSMSHNLQRKFARGVQYNMKIIIKGDRNVGKTCLLHRLKGEKFVEEYTPTDEIQVASIHWNYKATDDVVKVEVWDVVDRGNKKKTKKAVEGLKLDNIVAPAEIEEEEPVLDAEFLDVYKGTNGVILVMDITKNWTFDYVQRELPKVPEHIPVLVLANHCDMAHHRVVTSDHVSYFIESVQRSSPCAQIRYAESSMRNGFGLKFLHKFLNLPFLQLQRETLLAQLETNSNETKTTVSELDLFLAGPDADYNEFLEVLVNRRRQAADSASTAQAGDSSFVGAGPNQSTHNQNVNNGAVRGSPQPSDESSMRRAVSTPGSISSIGSGPVGMGNPIGTGQATGAGHVIGAGHPIGSGHPIGVGHPHPVGIRQPIGAGNPIPFAAPPAAVPKPDSSSHGKPHLVEDAMTPVKADGIMSKIFRNKKGPSTEESRPNALVGGNDAYSNNVTSVEEFVPDGGVIDRSFLEDTTIPPSPQQHSPQQPAQQPAHQPAQPIDSESEEEAGINPLVAGFQDDIDSEDEQPPRPVQSTENSPKNVLVNPNALLSKTSPRPPGLTTSSVSRKSSSSSSVSSSGAKATEDETVLDGEVSTITGDALDAWLTDSKWRRSPEGGEDNGSRGSDSSQRMKNVAVDSDQNASDDTGSVSHSDKKKKKSRHKDKSDEKGSSSGKKHKKKEKDKDKEKDKKKKKSSRKLASENRGQDELQEFLNGALATPVDSTYEPL